MISAFLCLHTFVPVGVLAGPFVEKNLEILKKVGALDNAPEATEKKFKSAPTIAQIIGYVINAILAILGVIFLALMVYAGFEWLTSGGDEKKVTTARGVLEQAIVGLMIVLGAYSITIFVTNALQKAAGV